MRPEHRPAPAAASAARRVGAPLARACGVAAIVAGCAAPPVPPPSQPTVSGAAAPTAATGVTGPARSARAYAWTERMDDTARRLRAALDGPADVSQTTDQRLWVSVPTADAFAAGRSAVKPTATGWLDQVALALRANPRAEVQIIGSADPGQRGGGAQALAIDRAASARDWLVARGIPAPRIAVAGVAARAAAAAADRRLDILIGERADAAR